MNWIREKGNILIVLVLVFVGVVLVLGGVYIYFHKSPEKIIKTMIIKMQDIKSFHCQIDVEINGKADISFEGDVDWHDISSPQISFLFSSRTVPEPLPPDLEGELRAINGVVYLKLSKLPILLEAFNLSQFKNQWIKIDIEAVKDQFGLKKSEPGSEVQSLDKLKELEDLAKEKGLYTIKEVSKDEVVNNVKTYHYSLALNKAEFKDFFIEVYKILLSQGQQVLSEEQLQQIDQALDQAAEEQMNAIKNIELWIGKKDHLLYKAMTSFNYVDQNKEASIALIFSVIFSNFDEPVNIAEPENVKPLEEILKSLSEDLKLILTF